MKNSELKENYLDENSFWHITNKLNIQSITREGLVPRDGKRNGESKSDEDPVPRVFFSQGLEGVLGQANNLAFLISDFIKNIERTGDGNSGKDVTKKMKEFLNSSVNDDIDKKDAPNGGFIDIANFIKNEIFENGIDENLTEQGINKIIYDIVKTIWENSICLKANLREGIDYSWNDVNYNAKGTRKVPMTKKNMHSFEGHTITPDILEIITDKKENPRTTWDIFKEMAIFYKKEHPNKEYLPVEEWESAFLGENGQVVYTGEMNHRDDYLSMFIQMEKEEKENIKVNDNGTLPISEGFTDKCKEIGTSKRAMERFYEAKNKLEQAEVAMYSVTKKYNEIVNGFDSQTLLMTNLLYTYRKVQTDYLIKIGKKETSEPDRIQIDTNFANYIKNNFGKEYSLQNIRQLVDFASQKSEPALDIIEQYKKELLKTYLSYSPVLRHATKVKGLTKLDASRNRENQYLNEVVDAVFASSGYSDMENYIGRANVQGMQVMENIVVYPENPFMDKGKQNPDGDIALKDNVYLYQMDATKFEPVVDFNRSKNGKYYLEFGQEWISRNESVECECEIIDSIPREAFERKQFFYKKQKIDVRTLSNGKSREDMIEAISGAIKSGKLGYINGELDIGAIEELREREVLKTKAFLQKIKDFFVRRKVKMLPESTTKTISKDKAISESKKSWDLENWGIDVKDFRREAEDISQNNMQSKGNELQTEQGIEQQDKSSNEKLL